MAKRKKGAERQKQRVRGRKTIVPNGEFANRLSPKLKVKEADNNSSQLRCAGKTKHTEYTIALDSPHLSGLFSEFDRSVHTAIANLFQQGLRCFTVRQVWYEISHSSNDPSSALREAIESSVDRQRQILIDLDYTEEARAYGLIDDDTHIESYHVESNLLQLEKHTIRTTNGRRVFGYKLLDMPMLLRYSLTVKRVITVPSELYIMPEKTQLTISNIAVRDYLVRRLMIMKSNPKTSKSIVYTSVYTAIGLHDPTAKQRHRINNLILAILDKWRCDKRIKGFFEEKRGRMRERVIVEL